MESFYCQLCGMDMATARIRTPDEPPSAAWNYRGINYVGFSPFRDYNGEIFPDQECQQCTTADRTTLDPPIAAISLPSWPDEEDEDDSEWLPGDDLSRDSESVGSNSETPETSSDENGGSYNKLKHYGSVSSDEDDWVADTNSKYPRSGLYNPPLPERLPFGTWYNGFIYNRGTHSIQDRVNFEFAFRGPTAPPEHIASPSCQSHQGINGHRLSVEEMKSCRNHRFLLAKPADWEPEATDRLLEEDSLFYLTGESNGSAAFMHRYLYPVRHGLRDLTIDCDFINEANNEYETARPVVAHSYCIDMYAKASYNRLGRVDLDGIWHWREIQSDPGSYGLGSPNPLPRSPAVERGRDDRIQPWRHIPGDEWLVANPVETPGVLEALDTCINGKVFENKTQIAGSTFLALPAELAHHILSFLDLSDLDTVADTCHLLYEYTKPLFKAYIISNMCWLWELFGGNQYPSSPDWPVAWDPLCLPGLEPPSLPADLDTEEDEDEVWAQILTEYPEMEEAGKAMRAQNAVRREEFLRPYRARQEASLREWQDFRSGVEAWIRDTPRDGANNIIHGGNVDWTKVWRLFNPKSTKIQGLRNRARIWSECERAVRLVAQAHELGEIENKMEDLRLKLSDARYTVNEG